MIFLIYMDIFVNQSRHLKFIDDTKCYLHIHMASDYNALKKDITALLTWSRESDLDFNLIMFLHLSFLNKSLRVPILRTSEIPHNNSHKDLGLILSDNSVGGNITNQFLLMHIRF